MLMLKFHLVLSMGLITLAIGAAVLIWSKIHANVGTTLAKTIGYVIIIMSILNILCTGYYAMKYRCAGYFDKPHIRMIQKNKMNNQMMQCPMMSEQMMKNKDMQISTTDQTDLSKQESDDILQDQTNKIFPNAGNIVIEEQETISADLAEQL
jgi:predicted membrane protein